MTTKLIKFFTIVSFLSIFSASSMAESFGQNSEYELFDRLKSDMWHMGLDFDYVQTVDLQSPTQGMMQTQDIDQEVSHQLASVKTVPYELIQRFESSF